LNDLPPLTGAILISNPRKEPTMALRRRNRTSTSKHAHRRKLPYIKRKSTPASARSTKWLRNKKNKTAAEKAELAHRDRNRKARAAAMKNPRKKNPDNAYTHWVSGWIRRNKSKLKGKSGIEKLKAANKAWNKLKRKPTKYIKKVKTASGVRRIKRRAGDQLRKGPAWNRFRKRNAGRGYSMKALGRAFAKNPRATLKPKPGSRVALEMAGKIKPKTRRSSTRRSSGSTRRSSTRAAGRTAPAAKRKPNEWNKLVERAAKAGVYTPGMTRAEVEAALAGVSSSVASHYRSSITGKSGYIKPHTTPSMADRILGSHYAANNGRRGRKARKNGLALTNPRLPDLLSPTFYYETARDDVVPVALGMSLGALAHALAASTGTTTKIMDGICWVGDWSDETIPVAGQVVQTVLQGATTYAPYTIQGSIVYIGSSVLAGALPKGRAKALAVGLGTSALAGGTFFDIYNMVTGFMSGMGAEEMNATEEAIAEAVNGNLSGLALQNMGGLALENGLGGIALDNMGGLAMQNMGGLALAPAYGSYGDGFAYETAPVQASQLDYGQSSGADAYYSGADFSHEEGEAMLQGEGAWHQAFGPTPYRPQGDASNASHLAGQPGHRWGWLIQTVGWDKAREICALRPAKRLKVIQAMRQSALDTWRQEVASATAGYGDPALFMG
jgi:hypothetical protein